MLHDLIFIVPEWEIIESAGTMTCIAAACQLCLQEAAGLIKHPLDNVSDFRQVGRSDPHTDHKYWIFLGLRHSNVLVSL